MTCFDCDYCIRDYMDKPYCFITQCSLSNYDAEDSEGADEYCIDFKPKEETE